MRLVRSSTVLTLELILTFQFFLDAPGFILNRNAAEEKARARELADQRAIEADERALMEEFERRKKEIDERKRSSTQLTSRQVPSESVPAQSISFFQDEEFLRRLRSEMQRLTDTSADTSPKTPNTPSANNAPDDNADTDNSDAPDARVSPSPTGRNTSTLQKTASNLESGKLHNPPCLTCVSAIYFGRASFCRVAHGPKTSRCYSCSKNSKKCVPL